MHMEHMLSRKVVQSCSVQGKGCTARLIIGNIVGDEISHGNEVESGAVAAASPRPRTDVWHKLNAFSANRITLYQIHMHV